MTKEDMGQMAIEAIIAALMRGCYSTAWYRKWLNQESPSAGSDVVQHSVLDDARKLIEATDTACLADFSKRVLAVMDEPCPDAYESMRRRSR